MFILLMVNIQLEWYLNTLFEESRLPPCWADDLLLLRDDIPNQLKKEVLLIGAPCSWSDTNGLPKEEIPALLTD